MIPPADESRRDLWAVVLRDIREQQERPIQ